MGDLKKGAGIPLQTMGQELVHELGNVYELVVYELVISYIVL